MSPMFRFICFLSVSFLALPSSLMAADELRDEIDKLINHADYRQGRWGILIVDDQGKTVYERDADRLFLPASVTKLYSCAAALGILGKDYKFETPVYTRGTIKDGKLKGDLILVGKGDLTFGGRTQKDGTVTFKNHDHIYATGESSDYEITETDPLAGLKSLAKQIKDKGIKEIDGDVLIDDRLFTHASGTGSGPATLTPILVNDNVVDLVVTPAAEVGKPAGVRVVPENRFLQIDDQVETVVAGGKTKIEVESVGFNRLKVRGSIPIKSKPVLAIYAVEDPASYARSLFIGCLRAAGIKVGASALEIAHGSLPEWEWYAKEKPLATCTSPPLSEAIKVTLKVSHNLYASLLPLLIAVKERKKTLAEGLKIQGEFLNKLGVDAKTISFAGGAGGANADAVTPRATVQLLRGMAAKHPEAYPAFVAAMPTLGVDGTLADVVAKNSPACGKVHAKTGTLMWDDLVNDRLLLKSKALAGIMTTAKGKCLTIALFVNDVPLPKGVKPDREGKKLGQLCEIIYKYAP
ncbi:MAG TPA: D-alanyl-D-alanine carboxypeptidase/D-alanyl-D-alanine-endopeptidase [Gemmataceae bacterium]|nr:D-alanyl-D-alanine carboxypeptidase/D-alanyl-D-alanine-endopeptidase [Gemmataceae bacterium]